MTLSTSSGERGIVAMWIVSSCEFFVSGKCRSKVEIGMMTMLSGCPPNPEAIVAGVAKLLNHLRGKA